MKKNLIFMVILVLTVSLFLCCKNAGPKGMKKGDTTDDIETIFAVNITKAVKGEINDYLDLNGDIKTKTEVDVYPDTIGKLTRISVNIGDRVNKDQEIAFVDPSRPGMTFALSPVKSPISGTITAIAGQIGSTVSQQLSIIKVGVLSDIQIVCFVSERYISKMKLGLDTILTIEAYPELQFYGKVTELSPVVDPQTRMMEVRVLLNQKNEKIMPGMFAKIKIVTEKKNNIVKIPAECIVQRYGDKLVFVVGEEERVEKRVIKTGIQIDNKVEVVSGLNHGESVVISGQTLLEDKTKVKIINVIDSLPVRDNIN